MVNVRTILRSSLANNPAADKLLNTVGQLQTSFVSLLYKLDADTGVADNDYAQDTLADCDAFITQYAPDSSFTCTDYESAGSGQAYIEQYRIGGDAAYFQTQLNANGCGHVDATIAIAELGLIADEFYLDPAFSCV